ELCSQLFSLHCSRARQALHSFPTRRSSDLRRQTVRWVSVPRHHKRNWRCLAKRPVRVSHKRRFEGLVPTGMVSLPAAVPALASRSEEHTSELQSRSDLVCRLLLEKKKKIHN